MDEVRSHVPPSPLRSEATRPQNRQYEADAFVLREFVRPTQGAGGLRLQSRRTSQARPLGPFPPSCTGLPGSRLRSILCQHLLPVSVLDIERIPYDSACFTFLAATWMYMSVTVASSLRRAVAAPHCSTSSACTKPSAIVGCRAWW